MNLARFGVKQQIAIVTAVETCRRIAAHDALQQYAASELQAPSLKETASRHHLAARNAIKVRSYAIDLIDTL